MEKVFQNTATRVLLALMCCALWGSAFPFVKIGYELFAVEGAGSEILFAGIRFFMAGIMTLCIACFLKKGFAKPKRALVPGICGQGLLQTTGQYVCFYIGLAHCTGAKGSVMSGTTAFFAILAAHFMTKDEKLSTRKVLGCLIGFLGVIAVNLAPGSMEGGFALSGEGLVLLSAVFYGVSSVTLKRLSKREAPEVITAYQLLFGGAVLILAGCIGGGKISVVTPRGLLVLVYLAGLSTVAFTVWSFLLKYNPISKVSIFSFSIPVFGVALSAIFLGEQVFTIQNLAGLALVGAGIVIVNTVSCKGQPDSVQ